MIRPRKDGGYTIVETLIFLAVSTALLGSAMALVGEQRNRAEFTYAVQELGSQIRDISNDVSTGYYESGEDFECEAQVSGPDIKPGSEEQGQNSECIFVGKIIQFAPADTPSTNIPNNQLYRVISVAGLRTTGSGAEERDVTTLAQSKPTLVDYSDQEVVIPGTMTVEWVRVNATGAHSAAFGYFTNFANYINNSNLLETNARNVQLAPLPVFGLNRFQNDLQNRLDVITDATVFDTSGVSACFQGNGYHTVIDIGAELTNLNSELKIERGSCPA